jgi:hypothetical protein
LIVPIQHKKRERGREARNTMKDLIENVMISISIQHKERERERERGPHDENPTKSSHINDVVIN